MSNVNVCADYTRKSVFTLITSSRTERFNSIEILLLHSVMEHISILPYTGTACRAVSEIHRKQDKTNPNYIEMDSDKMTSMTLHY